MPLFAWGRGYSWKLPIAEVAGGVPVEGSFVVVLLQETRNIVRSIREQKRDKRFIALSCSSPGLFYPQNIYPMAGFCFATQLKQEVGVFILSLCRAYHPQPTV